MITPGTGQYPSIRSIWGVDRRQHSSTLVSASPPQTSDNIDDNKDSHVVKEKRWTRLLDEPKRQIPHGCAPELPGADGPAAARNLGHNRIPIVVERLVRGPGFNSGKFQRSYCKDAETSSWGRSIQWTVVEASSTFPPLSKLWFEVIRRKFIVTWLRPENQYVAEACPPLPPRPIQLVKSWP
jgi:hypothetical protein